MDYILDILYICCKTYPEYYTDLLFQHIAYLDSECSLLWAAVQIPMQVIKLLQCYSGLLHYPLPQEPISHSHQYKLGKWNMEQKTGNPLVYQLTLYYRGKTVRDLPISAPRGSAPPYYYRRRLEVLICPLTLAGSFFTSASEQNSQFSSQPQQRRVLPCYCKVG